jgi:Excalibur calcium-binding domain
MKNIRPFKLNLTSRQLILSTAFLLTVDSFVGDANRRLQAGASPIDPEIPIAVKYPHAEAFFFIAQSQQREYKCEGKIYCSQMTSCEEATFYLKNCPNVKIDGDGDGIPCESQWCHS